ncbi:hypothetical protein MLD38_001792 [Melastoma candidum]|uniref:Uncharacterized protein n=1 Tax=Melastoma candidum TaxID=119954 RepID=A0ACB9SEC0_9MYRT|nr:hypothetical protein MLD38_001792 [Melastoma candidum]
MDSSCSSDSSSHGSSKKIAERRRRLGDSVRPASAPKCEEREDAPERRCDWITQFSDPLYVHFHDKEWGVPIYDDKKLFELLFFSQALAELQWPMILNNREIFRKCFVNFDPSSVAQLGERSLSSLKVSGSTLLSEMKLRAIIEDAKQTVKDCKVARRELCLCSSSNGTKKERV